METWVVIGVSGQFGQFMAEFLLKNQKNVIGISRNKPDQKLFNHKNFSYLEGDASKKLSPKNLEVIKKSNAVLFSVPIALTDLCIRKIAPQMQPGQLICDVTSVKVIPLKAMLKFAPAEVEILGMHPMFSPTLVLDKKNVILVPLRLKTEKLNKIAEMFQKAKANITIMTAKEHDQMVAVTQALAHFITWSFGKTLVEIKWDFKEMAKTESTFYKLLKSLLERILSFDPNLYAQIQLYNPEAPKVIKAFIQSAYKLYKSIRNRREQDLLGMMREIIQAVPVDGDIVEKTNNMYKVLE